MYKKVLLPVEGGNRCQRSKIALEKALDICDGVIILLHVSCPLPDTIGGEQRVDMEREAKAQGMVLLTPLIEQLQSSGRHFHAVVEEGTTAETIVKVADDEQADLIVMFQDDSETLKEFLLGNTTERVLRNADVDLLVVKKPD